MPKSSKLIPSESQTQIAYFHWVKLKESQDDRFLAVFAVPNAGARTPRAGARMKAEGLRAGIPDIFCSIPSKGYHGLYIELKKKGGKISPNQITYLDLFTKYNYLCKVCYSLSELIEVTEDYLNG